MTSLSETLKTINKQHGQGSVFRLGDHDAIVLDRISTRWPSLDIALGGGVPRGRVTEIYGPESGGKTTLTLQTIAECQKAGGQAAFVDAEHALDTVYAGKLGVDVDNLLVSQPDNGEQALEITEALIRSGGVDIVVVDSVAALVPKAEIEGEMGDSHMGLQARLMSQALRKLTGIVSKSNTALIFINQIREKIGVMFGCLHGDEIVHFADGRRLPIRTVVRNKVRGDVLTLDNGLVVSRPIVGWYENGKLEPESEVWHIITTETAGCPGGATAVCVTPQHTLYAADGSPVKAEQVKPGDLLTTYATVGRLSERVTRSIVFGSLLGDGHLRVRSRSTAALSLANQEQPEYLKWKLTQLKHLGFRPNGSVTRPAWTSEYSHEFKMLRDLFYTQAGDKQYRAIPEDLVLNDTIVAVWYMDDGCLGMDNEHKRGRPQISVKRLNINNRNLAVEKLNTWLGVDAFFPSHSSIHIGAAHAPMFFGRIQKHVPPCMEYKLPPAFRGKYEEPARDGAGMVSIGVPAKVLSVSSGSPKKMRQLAKFDIQVEGSHRYFAGGKYGGLLVHNSPETTTGGRALKFYSSIRIDIRRIAPIKVGDEVIGARTRAKVVKNKTARPFLEAESDLLYGEGISYEGDLLDLGVTKNVIEKSGAWFSYQGERMGQGRENARLWLKDNKAVAEEISKKLFSPDNLLASK